MSHSAPTTDDLVSALRRLHTNYGLGDRWAFFEELRLGTGYGRGVEQRIDAFACGLWTKNWGSMAYEVKTRRTDFLKELRKPLKRRLALRYSNLFWFVTPEGLVKPEELPIEAGLMEGRWATVGYNPPTEGWTAKVVIPAPWRDVPPPTWSLFASVARRVARIERRADEQGKLKALERLTYDLHRRSGHPDPACLRCQFYKILKEEGE